MGISDSKIRLHVFHWKFGEHGDAIVRFLTCKLHILETQSLDRVDWKPAVNGLSLLEAENIRLVFPDESCHLVDSGLEAVDVEGRHPHAVPPEKVYPMTPLVCGTYQNKERGS